MTLTYALFRKHIADILDYWKIAVDWKNGGINFRMWVHKKRSPVRSEKKCLLMHVRQLYDYSVGHAYGISGSTRIARHLLDTLDSVFPKIRGMYRSGYRSRGGDWFHSTGRRLSSYDQFYTVVGLSKFAWAFKDAAVYLKAKDLHFRTIEFFTDRNLAARGVFDYYDQKTDTKKRKSGNSMLHCLEATLNLALAARSHLAGAELEAELAEYRALAAALYRLFMSKLFDTKNMLTPDHFTDSFGTDQMSENGFVTMGHPLEWVGFWYEAEMLLGMQFAFVRTHGAKLADITLNRAAAKTGCFMNWYSVAEGRCAEFSEFWGQVEGTLGALYAYKAYGSRKYLKTASSLAGFYFDKYRDPRLGGIYSEVTVSGLPFDRAKGGAYKCDHHSLRMCEKTIEYRLLG